MPRQLITKWCDWEDKSCIFRYSYDPFQQSLNDNPEYELPLSAGDYVLIWGNVDDVSIKII